MHTSTSRHPGQPYLIPFELKCSGIRKEENKERRERGREELGREGKKF